MPIPLQITFKNMDPSEAVETKIRQRVEKLSRHADRITACHVVVEAPHRNHQKGLLYSVRVDLTIPGDELVVNREHNSDPAHEDVYVAVRDAFDATQRQLESHENRRRDLHRRPS
jgi:ribosomal subunit interface protein